MNLFRKAVLAGALGAATLTTASPAMADHYRRGGDTTGAAIAGGIVGLALGAAIASNGRDRYDDGYYYDGYYDRRAYPRYRTYYVYRDYPRYYRPYRDDWRRHDRRHHHRDWGHRGW